MNTAVVTVELTQPATTLEVGAAYHQAFVVVRYAGRPVGFIWLPVRQGLVHTAALQRTLVDAAGWPGCLAWLAQQGEGANTTNPNLDATIAICTRDRPADLDGCLRSLAGFSQWPILVIDSASQGDTTRQVVERFPYAQWVREELPGEARARNRALREATTPIVAFLDDDAQPDAAWLYAGLPPFADPLVGCVTGLTLPAVLATPAQHLFEQFTPFGRGFVPQPFSLLNHNPADANAPGSGNNMLIRREAALECGGFDQRFGPGTPTRSGSDAMFYADLIRAGWTIVYEPAAMVWHTHRDNEAALADQLEKFGMARTARLFHDAMHGELDTLRQLWHLPRESFVALALDSIRRRPNQLPANYGWRILRGLLRGPWGYWQSRRQLTRGDQP